MSSLDRMSVLCQEAIACTDLRKAIALASVVGHQQAAQTILCLLTTKLQVSACKPVTEDCFDADLCS